MKNFSLILVGLFFIVSCGDTVKKPSSNTDADTLTDSDEAVQDDSDEVAKDDSDEVVKDDSDEAVQDDSDETVKDDSDEVETSDDDVTLLENGESCLDGVACKSGKCVDEYCCDTSCDSLCEACNVAGHLGECLPILDGQDPADECVASDASTCGQNGFCDGASACAVYNTATVCSSTCDATNINVSVLYCDGAEHCVPPIQTVACNNYICSADMCLDSCDDGSGGDDHALCDNTHYCQSGDCSGERLDNNERCEHDYECKSNDCSGYSFKRCD